MFVFGYRGEPHAQVAVLLDLDLDSYNVMLQDSAGVTAEGKMA